MDTVAPPLNKRHIIFKSICIALVIALLWNDISFAADEMLRPASNGAGKSALAIPNRFTPPCTIIREGDNIRAIDTTGDLHMLERVPQLFLLYLIASALSEGLTKSQTTSLVEQTITNADNIPDFKWRELEDGQGENKEFTLLFKDKKWVFSEKEPKSEEGCITKLECKGTDGKKEYVYVREAGTKKDKHNLDGLSRAEAAEKLFAQGITGEDAGIAMIEAGLIDRRAYDAGLLSAHAIAYSQLICDIVNPEYKSLVGLYGGAGADASRFFLSTDADIGVFVSLEKEFYYEHKISSRDIRLYRDQKRRDGYAWTYDIAGAIWSYLMLELEDMGATDIECEPDENGIWHITFNWNGRKREIVYIYNTSIVAKTDLSRKLMKIKAVKDGFQDINERLSGKFDIYYQCATDILSSNYSRYMESIHDRIKPNGWVITNDFSSLGNKSRKKPLLKAKEKFKYLFNKEYSPFLYAENWNMTGYGREMSLYRVRDIQPQQPAPSEQPFHFPELKSGPKTPEHRNSLFAGGIIWWPIGLILIYLHACRIKGTILRDLNKLVNRNKWYSPIAKGLAWFFDRFLIDLSRRPILNWLASRLTPVPALMVQEVRRKFVMSRDEFMGLKKVLVIDHTEFMDLGEEILKSTWLPGALHAINEDLEIDVIAQRRENSQNVFANNLHARLIKYPNFFGFQGRQYDLIIFIGDRSTLDEEVTRKAEAISERVVYIATNRITATRFSEAEGGHIEEEISSEGLAECINKYAYSKLWFSCLIEGAEVKEEKYLYVNPEETETAVNIVRHSYEKCGKDFDSDKRRILINPFAKKFRKIMDKEFTVNLILRLLKEFPDKEIWLTPGLKEETREILNEIIDEVKHRRPANNAPVQLFDLRDGRLNLRELISVIDLLDSEHDLLIGADTATTHIASALGKKSIAYYLDPSLTPEIWAPDNDYSHSIKGYELRPEQGIEAIIAKAKENLSVREGAPSDYALEDLVGGRLNLEYQNRICEIVNPERGRKTTLYIGSGTDISSVLLTTDATDFIFVDRLPFVTAAPRTMAEKDRLINSYLSEKRELGWVSSEFTLQPMLEIWPFLKKELEILNAEIIQQPKEINPGVFEITFRWNGKERQLIFVSRTDAHRISAYSDYIEQLGGVDYFILKAGDYSARDGMQRPRELVDKIALNFLNPSGFLILDDLCVLPSDDVLGILDKKEDAVLKNLGSRGAKFGYDVERQGVHIYKKVERIDIIQSDTKLTLYIPYSIKDTLGADFIQVSEERFQYAQDEFISVGNQLKRERYSISLPLDEVNVGVLLQQIVERGTYQIIHRGPERSILEIRLDNFPLLIKKEGEALEELGLFDTKIICERKGNEGPYQMISFAILFKSLYTVDEIATTLPLTEEVIGTVKAASFIKRSPDVVKLNVFRRLASQPLQKRFIHMLIAGLGVRLSEMENLEHTATRESLTETIKKMNVARQEILDLAKNCLVRIGRQYPADSIWQLQTAFRKLSLAPWHRERILEVLAEVAVSSGDRRLIDRALELVSYTLRSRNNLDRLLDGELLQDIQRELEDVLTKLPKGVELTPEEKCLLENVYKYISQRVKSYAVRRPEDNERADNALHTLANLILSNVIIVRDERINEGLVYNDETDELRIPESYIAPYVAAREPDIPELALSILMSLTNLEAWLVNGDLEYINIEAEFLYNVVTQDMLQKGERQPDGDKPSANAFVANLIPEGKWYSFLNWIPRILLSVGAIWPHEYFGHILKAKSEKLKIKSDILRGQVEPLITPERAPPSIWFYLAGPIVNAILLISSSILLHAFGQNPYIFWIAGYFLVANLVTLLAEGIGYYLRKRDMYEAAQTLKQSKGISFIGRKMTPMFMTSVMSTNLWMFDEFKKKLSKKDFIRLVKLITWAEMDYDMVWGGRSVIMNLSSPLLIDGVEVKAIKIKGIGYYDGAKLLPPVMESYYGSGRAEASEQVDSDGRISFRAPEDRPIGSMLFDRARQELHMTADFTEAGIPTYYPIGYGEFSNLRFRNRNVGFVLLGLEDINFVSIFDELCRLRNTIQNAEAAEEYMPHLLTMVKKYARFLRYMHDKGFIHNFYHPENVLINQNGDLFVGDLDNAIPTKDMTDAKRIAWRLLDLSVFFDKKSSIRAVYHNLFKNLLDKETLRMHEDAIIRAIMESYFHDISKKELAGFSEDNLRKATTEAQDRGILSIDNPFINAMKSIGTKPNLTERYRAFLAFLTAFLPALAFLFLEDVKHNIHFLQLNFWLFVVNSIIATSIAVFLLVYRQRSIPRIKLFLNRIWNDWTWKQILINTLLPALINGSISIGVYFIFTKIESNIMLAFFPLGLFISLPLARWYLGEKQNWPRKISGGFVILGGLILMIYASGLSPFFPLNPYILGGITAGLISGFHFPLWRKIFKDTYEEIDKTGRKKELFSALPQINIAVNYIIGAIMAGIALILTNTHPLVFNGNSILTMGNMAPLLLGTIVWMFFWLVVFRLHQMVSYDMSKYAPMSAAGPAMSVVLLAVRSGDLTLSVLISLLPALLIIIGGFITATGKDRKEKIIYPQEEKEDAAPMLELLPDFTARAKRQYEGIIKKNPSIEAQFVEALRHIAASPETEERGKHFHGARLRRVSIYAIIYVVQEGRPLVVAIIPRKDMKKNVLRDIRRTIDEVIKGKQAEPSGEKPARPRYKKPSAPEDKKLGELRGIIKGLRSADLDKRIKSAEYLYAAFREDWNLIRQDISLRNELRDALIEVVKQNPEERMFKKVLLELHLITEEKLDDILTGIKDDTGTHFGTRETYGSRKFDLMHKEFVREYIDDPDTIIIRIKNGEMTPMRMENGVLTEVKPHAPPGEELVVHARPITGIPPDIEKKLQYYLYAYPLPFQKDKAYYLYLFQGSKKDRKYGTSPFCLLDRSGERLYAEAGSGGEKTGYSIYSIYMTRELFEALNIDTLNYTFMNEEALHAITKVDKREILAPEKFEDDPKRKEKLAEVERQIRAKENVKKSKWSFLKRCFSLSSIRMPKFIEFLLGFFKIGMFADEFRLPIGPRPNPEAIALVRRATRIDLLEARLNLLFEALALDPNNPVIMNKIAHTYLKLRDVSNANIWVNRSIRKAKELQSRYEGYARHTQSISYGILSNIYLECGELQQTLGAAEKAVEMAPHNPVAYGRLSTVLFAMGRLQDALDAADRYIELDPNEAVAYGHRCNILIAMGRLNDALDAANEGLRLRPNDPIGHGHLVNVLLNLGRPEEALDISNIYISMDSSNTAYGIKANVLFALSLKTLILEPDKAAEFAKKQLEEIRTERQRYTSAILKHLEYLSNNRTPEIPHPEILTSGGEEHIIRKHSLINLKPMRRGGYNMFFPPGLNRDEIIQWVKKALDSLSPLRENGSPRVASVRELPEGHTLDWWSKNVFVVYIKDEKTEELIRMVIIGDPEKKVITAFPTFGPGISCRRGSIPKPMESISIAAEGNIVWNKKSKQPINVCIGDSSKGFVHMLYSELLSPLEPIEREQLVWLTAVEGELAGEDENHRYYKYEVPYAEWNRKFGLEKGEKKTVFLKVSKESLRVVEITDSVPTDDSNIRYGSLEAIGLALGFKEYYPEIEKLPFFKRLKYFSPFIHAPVLGELFKMGLPLLGLALMMKYAPNWPIFKIFINLIIIFGLVYTALHNLNKEDFKKEEIEEKELDTLEEIINTVYKFGAPLSTTISGILLSCLAVFYLEVFKVLCVILVARKVALYFLYKKIPELGEKKQKRLEVLLRHKRWLKVLKRMSYREIAILIIATSISVILGSALMWWLLPFKAIIFLVLPLLSMRAHYRINKIVEWLKCTFPNLRYASLGGERDKEDPKKSIIDMYGKDKNIEMCYHLDQMSLAGESRSDLPKDTVQYFRMLSDDEIRHLIEISNLAMKYKDDETICRIIRTWTIIWPNVFNTRRQEYIEYFVKQKAVIFSYLAERMERARRHDDYDTVCEILQALINASGFNQKLAEIILNIGRNISSIPASHREKISNLVEELKSECQEILGQGIYKVRIEEKPEIGATQASTIHKKRKSSGFTLTKLLITITAIILVLAIANSVLAAPGGDVLAGEAAGNADQSAAEFNIPIWFRFVYVFLIVFLLSKYFSYKNYKQLMRELSFKIKDCESKLALLKKAQVLTNDEIDRYELVIAEIGYKVKKIEYEYTIWLITRYIKDLDSFRIRIEELRQKLTQQVKIHKLLDPPGAVQYAPGKGPVLRWPTNEKPALRLDGTEDENGGFSQLGEKKPPQTRSGIAAAGATSAYSIWSGLIMLGILFLHEIFRQIYHASKYYQARINKHPKSIINKILDRTFEASYLPFASSFIRRNIALPILGLIYNLGELFKGLTPELVPASGTRIDALDEPSLEDTTAVFTENKGTGPSSDSAPSPISKIHPPTDEEKKLAPPETPGTTMKSDEDRRDEIFAEIKQFIESIDSKLHQLLREKLQPTDEHIGYPRVCMTAAHILAQVLRSRFRDKYGLDIGGLGLNRIDIVQAIGNYPDNKPFAGDQTILILVLNGEDYAYIDIAHVLMEESYEGRSLICRFGDYVSREEALRKHGLSDIDEEERRRSSGEHGGIATWCHEEAYEIIEELSRFDEDEPRTSLHKPFVSWSDFFRTYEDGKYALEGDLGIYKQEIIDSRLEEHQQALIGLLEQSEPKEGQSIILYAEDILKNVIFYDFEKTLGLVKNRLRGGKVILWTRNNEDSDDVVRLQALIQNIVGKETTVKILSLQNYGDHNWQREILVDNPIREIQQIIDEARQAGIIVKEKDILAIIRGNGIKEFVGLWSAYAHELQAPLVIVDDSLTGADYGVYSFAEAILRAVKSREQNETRPKGLRNWIEVLHPIGAISQKMYEEYIRYRDDILTQA